MRLRGEGPIGFAMALSVPPAAFLPGSWVVHRRSGAKQGTGVVAECGRHDQPVVFDRLHADGHFKSVDIFVCGTVSSRRCSFRGHYIRESVRELPVSRHLSAAVHT